MFIKSTFAVVATYLKLQRSMSRAMAVAALEVIKKDGHVVVPFLMSSAQLIREVKKQFVESGIQDELEANPFDGLEKEFESIVELEWVKNAKAAAMDLKRAIKTDPKKFVSQPTDIH